jgi:hypothetical protein
MLGTVPIIILILLLIGALPRLGYSADCGIILVRSRLRHHMGTSRALVLLELSD